jgi:chromosome segregation ATPase
MKCQRNIKRGMKMLSIKSRVKMEVDKKRYAQICAQAERANDLEQQVRELKKQLAESNHQWESLREILEDTQREVVERDEKIAYLESYITSQNDSFDVMMKDRAAHDKALIYKCADICISKEDAEYATGKVDHNEMSWCRSCAESIKKELTK